MKNNIINKLTSGKIKNPITNKTINIPIDRVVVDSGAINDLAQYVKNLPCTGTKLKVAVISDENTHFAAGAEIERALCKDCEISSIVMPSNINANIENIQILNAYTVSAEILIAVGGGTINDLCKYTSFVNGKKYISVPTCTSVNGFSSANASITKRGIKESFIAHLPMAIFADVDVLVQAPKRLIISGLGDSLARPTAQADWLLSHYILETEYNPICFEILEETEAKLFNNCKDLLNSDFEAIKTLMELLILSGLSMYIAGSSNPASQAEHLISHYIEMMHGDNLSHTYHGEEIAVTSIAIAKIQQEILNMEKLQLHPIIHSEKPILLHFGEEKGGKFIRECSKKEITGAKLTYINSLLKKDWNKIRDKIKSIHISPKKLKEIIISIDGPYTYRHLAWEHNIFQDALTYAPYIRDRFTFLDFAIGLKSTLEEIG